MPYSRIARHYHLLERFTMWNALKKARLAHLDQLAKHGDVQNVLLVGEGNGSFLLPFVQRYPGAKVLVIDSCPTMIETAKQRLQLAGYNHSNVRFELADMQQAELPNGSFDVIVTHFFFDNFDQAIASNLVAKVASAAAPRAQWIWADFSIPASGWRALRARFWLTVLYLFFGQVASISARKLPDVEPTITDSGFAPIKTRELCGQLLRTIHFARLPPEM